MKEENYNAALKRTILELLKPCPCCGGVDLHYNMPDSEMKEHVLCCTCGLKMTKALGLNAPLHWNKRT